MGMEKCKRRAREVFFFWPGLNADVDKFLETCTTCTSNRRKQQAEPMKAHKTPEIPWEKVEIDLFTVNAIDYLAVVDYYSQYIRSHRLEAPQAKQ